MVTPGKSILKNLEPDVAAINEALAANLQTHVPLIAKVGRHILLSGGKRIRPLLFILSARMCGCQGNHLNGFSTIFEGRGCVLRGRSIRRHPAGGFLHPPV